MCSKLKYAIIKSASAKEVFNIANDLVLMMKDTVIMKINVDEGVYDIINEKYLPWVLKKRIQEPYPEKTSYTKYDIIQMQIIARKNYEAIISWLANRVLTLSRANAKWLYNLLKFEQVQSDEHKAKIALFCKAVSLQDSYWIKSEDSSLMWDDVNIRTNSLNEVIAQVALHGKSLTLQGSLTTPELTTQGTYAKAWRRYPDGSLWLHKLGYNGDTESKIEVMCSKLLDKMSVSHVHYAATTDEDKYVCTCPCMTTDDIAILSGMDFSSYCIANDLDFEKEYLRIDAESMYKMWIIDYILCNRDRHGQNWGFFYNVNTMEILGCHPLYDHNNAFDLEFMKDREASYQFGNMTIRQAAKLAISRVDFYFTEEITREDFLTDRQYNEFMWRVKDLGIEIKPRQ